jgi:hypothetical protein
VWRRFIAQDGSRLEQTVNPYTFHLGDIIVTIFFTSGTDSLTLLYHVNFIDTASTASRSLWQKYNGHVLPSTCQYHTSTRLHLTGRAVVTFSHVLSDQPEEYNNKTSKKIFTGTLISFALCRAQLLGYSFISPCSPSRSVCARPAARAPTVHRNSPQLASSLLRCFRSCRTT